ncbi:unnamed protein product [Larinioides sclopetarius]|uniref:Fatty acid hydroxylase domain-containing protein n=1 Tax=Larinioides sclopetarius TaxID=280406 RepID=A0AAV2AYZ0_9ARAC
MLDKISECDTTFPAMNSLQAPTSQKLSVKTFLGISISILISLVTFRPNLVWNLLYLWKAVGVCLQDTWNIIYDSVGHDEYAMVVWGSILITTLVYWIVGLCYTFFDMTGKPAFLLKYKTQGTASYPVSADQVLAIMKQVFINQLIVIPFAIHFYHLMVWRGYDSGRALPNFQRTLLEVLFCAFLDETGYYYAHRLLHHPFFYKHIHKRHHEWTAPIAITALYTHPVEHILVNLLPLLLGPLILGSHMVTIWLWFCIAIVSTLGNHSGFDFPFMSSAKEHDIHHLKFNQNYGILGLLDRLHGTDSLPPAK